MIPSLYLSSTALPAPETDCSVRISILLTGKCSTIGARDIARGTTIQLEHATRAPEPNSCCFSSKTRCSGLTSGTTRGTDSVCL